MDASKSSELPLQVNNLAFEVRFSKEEQLGDLHQRVLEVLEVIFVERQLVFISNEEEGVIMAFGTSELEPEQQARKEEVQRYYEERWRNCGQRQEKLIR